MNNFSTTKLYWHDLKDFIKVANFEFFKLVDKLSPGSDFPLYKLNFPYGTLIGDEISQFIPYSKELMRLNDPHLAN